VSFSLDDKVKIALKLNELGVDYIEGGWPFSNPKDLSFFKAIKEYPLDSKIAAFGSTRRKGVEAKNDENLNSIVSTEAEAAVIFGKSWTLHVREVIKVDEEENIRMIQDSIEFLREHGMEVIYDAEHFFQGFQENSEYAVKTLKAAEEAGARAIVLCDTNGGTTPLEIFNIVSKVRKELNGKIGAHMHNDIGCAVANTILAVEAGATHIQGTINGIGERTGNADLTQILPTLELKLGFKVLKEEETKVKFGKLKELSRMVYEILNVNPNPYQPYFGEFAFAHKGGVHADAVMKVPRAYEHIEPELVGNKRVIVISEMGGGASLVMKVAESLGLKMDKRDERVRKSIDEIKRLESIGYSFDTAPSSALLIALRNFGLYEEFFNIIEWKVISEEKGNAYAIVRVKAGNEILLEAKEGVGPVNAIDNAIRAALSKAFPEIDKVKLTDYKVMLPSLVKNTESLVRVTIEFSDGEKIWKSIGISKNVIEASLIALRDGLDYFLQLEKNPKLKPLR
jgi:2-isopropylmalate synthase